MELTKIRHILEVKGNDVWGISPEAIVYDVLCMSNNKDVGALLSLMAINWSKLILSEITRAK